MWRIFRPLNKVQSTCLLVEIIYNKQGYKIINKQGYKIIIFFILISLFETHEKRFFVVNENSKFVTLTTTKMWSKMFIFTFTDYNLLHVTKALGTYPKNTWVNLIDKQSRILFWIICIRLYFSKISFQSRWLMNALKVYLNLKPKISS